MSERGLRCKFSRIVGETDKDVLATPFTLPAVLSGFSWTEDFVHTEYTTARLGEFSTQQQGGSNARSLRTVDAFDTLTVKWDPQWLTVRGLDPIVVRDSISAIGRAKTPVQMDVTLDNTSDPLLSMPITLRSVSSSLRPGEPDAIYYNLSVKEWRSDNLRRRAAGTASVPDRSYPITKETTLSFLSKKYYGTYDHWQEIALLNGLVKWGQSTPIYEHPRFKIGDSLKLPKIDQQYVTAAGPGGVVTGLGI